MGKRTKTDPTGQAANRRRATRQLQQRLAAAERSVKRLFADIPRTRRRVTGLTNALTIPVYDYQITADELEILEQRIRATVGDVVIGTSMIRMPPNWWWQEPLEQSYREGTVEETVEFNQLVTTEVIRTRAARGLPTLRLEIGQVLRSPEYLAALDRVYVRNWGQIRSLSDTTASQVIQQINSGISAGLPPTAIRDNITERISVAKASAKRIADTETSRAYNDARLTATDVASRLTGLRAGVLHLSALLLTTRSTHAARHGNAYTTDQQRQWWDSGSNRINCKCSTRSVLIDAAGNVIDVELQEEIQAEREMFN